MMCYYLNVQFQGQRINVLSQNDLQNNWPEMSAKKFS